MRARVLLLLVTTTLLAVTAATALLAPVPETPPTRDDAPQARRAAPSSADEPGLVVLSASETRQSVRVAEGAAVRVQVRSEAPVAVQLGDDGPVEHADAGAPAEFAVFGEPGLDEAVTVVEPTPAKVIGRVRVPAP